jgi:ribonuclease HI
VLSVGKQILGFLTKRLPRQAFQVYVDGAIGKGKGCSGAGAVVVDRHGLVLGIAGQPLGKMTNNEAEYEGLLLGLSKEVHIFGDSEVVMGQMRGDCGVRSGALRLLHQQACKLSRRFIKISFTHIPRERNRLADAVAQEAMAGRPIWRS